MFLCPFFFYACSLTSKIGIVQKNTWCLASQNTQAVRYTVNKLYLCCVNYHVVLLQKEEMPVSSWLILSCEIKCTVFADIKLVSQMRALLKKIKPYPSNNACKILSQWFFRMWRTKNINFNPLMRILCDILFVCHARNSTIMTVYL